MRSAPLPATFFSRNRSKLVEEIGPGSLAVFSSASKVVRSADQYFPFRQQSDFFYLTGIDQDECALVMLPGHPEPDKREILFIRKSDPKTDLWSGPRLSKVQATTLSGISQVRWMDELFATVGELVSHAQEFCLMHSENGNSTGRSGISDVRLHKNLTGQYPHLQVTSVASLLTGLRMVKEFEELDEIRKAIAITGLAFQRVLEMLRPGIKEYEVEAELSAIFTAHGTQGHAFDPIVASGSNALILHYTQNSDHCQDGEMVLLDFGASVNYYSADCSRTLPVNGRFSERQRQVYEANLRIFEQARELMVPGILIGDFHNQVGKLWEEEHIRLGLYTLEDCKKQDPEDPLWKRYFMHGTSHSLGLDVHDPFIRTEPLQAGMVLTCEPAIYIPGEGMGIRLENDILITENGPVDLMEEIPMGIDEIEQRMN